MRRVVLILALTNLMTLLVLAAILHRFRILPKAYQRFVVEQRVPLAKSSHENNRYFASQRSIHNLYPPREIDLLLIGDSLVSEVSWQELMYPSAVAGRGIPGDTSTGVLIRLPDYESLQPKKIAFLFGTNDIIFSGDRVQLQKNQAEICTTTKTLWPEAKIVMITPPLVSAWIDNAEEVNLEMQRYHEFLKSSPGSFGVLDMTDAWNQDGYLKRELTSDGVHLNSKGYSELVARLQELDE